MAESLASFLKVYAREKIKIGDAAPVCEIHIYNQYVNMGPPHILKNALSVQWDRKEENLAASATVTVSNPDGMYTGDYDPSKFPYMDLLSNGYKRVFYPNNKIEIYTGYGDELQLQFTGTIDKVSIDSENETLEVSARDNMKYLIDQMIVPDDERVITYPKATENPWLASAIIEDLITMAGCVCQVEESIFNGKPYPINEISFELGTKYIDAIKKITDSLGYIIYADRNGIIICQRQIKGQKTKPDWEFFDYINLTSSSYILDPQDARNKIIICGSNGWEEFENPGFNKVFSPKFDMVAKIDIPWADTPEKRLMAAQSAFAIMHRRYRRITVGIVGNPGMELGDLVRMNDVVTASTGIYRITGINSTIDGESYADSVDLEFNVDISEAGATPTGRMFGQATINWVANGYWLTDRQERERIFDTFGTWNECTIRITDTNETYYGCTIRLLYEVTGFRVTTDFNFDSILAKADPDGENDPSELQARGIPDYETGVKLKNSVANGYGGKILYISAGTYDDPWSGASYVAIIGATTSTSKYAHDIVHLRFLNIAGICGRSGDENHYVPWRIKMITF